MLRETFDLNTISTFSKGVAITSIDTTVEDYWNFLKIDSKDIIFEEAEHVIVRISFTGSPSSQYSDESISDSAQPTYDLSGTLAEVSFSEHPKFKALSSDERATLGKLMSGQAEWVYDEINLVWAAFHPRTGEGTGNKLPSQEQLSAGDATEFAELIAEGRNTYLRPSFTWTETTQGNTPMNPAQLSLLGRVSNPRGTPPEPSGSRNWMLTSASQTQRGELYQTRLEWTLSERGGHNEFLYTS